MGEAQRKARNEAVFREVNERIEEVARDFEVPGQASFVCECGDVDCTEMVSMTLREYNDLRTNRRRFAILPGHEDPSVERVVARTPRFFVVEKTDEAGEVAEELA
jgi:hypothetical protein